MVQLPLYLTHGQISSPAPPPLLTKTPVFQRIPHGHGAIHVLDKPSPDYFFITTAQVPSPLNYLNQGSNWHPSLQLTTQPTTP